MNLTENAKKNLHRLFPDHQSSLHETDSEFMELLNNFAFDEIIGEGDFDLNTRMMMILGSLIATQSLTIFKIMLQGALNIGVTAVEVKEIVYQSVPYLGIGKVIDFINATNNEFERVGIKLPIAGQSTTTADTRQEKGLAVQKAIFGNVIDSIYEKSPQNQLHIQKALSANCFGDYYTRTGLELKKRELLTFVILISLGGVESQVSAHVQGNLNVGNDKDLLIGVVTQLIPYIGYPKTLNAIRAINEVSAE